MKIPGTVRDRLTRIPLRHVAVRYLGTLGTVVAVTLVLHLVPIEDPVLNILFFVILAICAWVGGVGPSLLMTPLLMVLGWLFPREGVEPSGFGVQQIIAFAILGAILLAFGLAGQYRRRIRTVTEQHAQRLRDQARALSLAHIVFREVDGRVTEWSDGAEQMFGWSSREAVGRDLHELLQTEFSHPDEEIQWELCRTGQWQGEVTHQTKDGLVRAIATHWILYRDRHGNPMGVAEVHNDVTELRRAEETIREADRRKDEFLAMLAHELRNPLAPIRTGLELMRMAKDDPDTLELTLSTMERQTQQLVRLVDDLLDVSRITRGKLDLRTSIVSLPDVVQNAVDASRSFIDAASHELTVEIADSPLYVKADPNRLAQVISNLLNNAAKYTPAGGQIRLTAEQQAPEVLLSVQDTGIGIPAHMLDHIFEVFAQIEHPMEQGHAGLGIGLSLARSIVEMHGGQIEVQSEGQNQGSKFVVRLPILVETPEIIPHQGLVDASETNHQRRVLVVDDNPAAADMLSLMVKRFGNDVRTARNGREATRMASEFRPQVVFMDLGMPVMDGFEAARHIRQQPWGKDILLVALTGWGQEGDKLKSKSAGFDCHLVKPAEPSDLQQLLARTNDKVPSLPLQQSGA